MNFLSNLSLVSVSLSFLSSVRTTSNTYHFHETATGGDTTPSYHHINNGGTAANGATYNFLQTTTGTPGLTSAPGTMPPSGPGFGARFGGRFGAGGYAPFGYCGGYNPGLIGRVLGSRSSFGCGPYGY